MHRSLDRRTFKRRGVTVPSPLRSCLRSCPLRDARGCRTVCGAFASDRRGHGAGSRDPARPGVLGAPCGPAWGPAPGASSPAAGSPVRVAVPGALVRFRLLRVRLPAAVPSPVRRPGRLRWGHSAADSGRKGLFSFCKLYSLELKYFIGRKWIHRTWEIFCS